MPSHRPTSARAAALMLATALLASLATSLPASVANAAVDGVNPPPTFFDEDGDGLLDVAEGPSPVNFLGLGDDDFVYVSEIAVGTLGQAYGFDASRADVRDYAGSASYLDTLTRDEARIDVGRPRAGLWHDTLMVQTHGNTVEVVGRQSEGFPSTPIRIWGDAPVADDEHVPGAIVDAVVLADQVDRTFVAVASTEGVYLYEIAPQPADCLPCAELVARYELPRDAGGNGPVAVALTSPPARDASAFGGALYSPFATPYFVLATATAGPAGDRIVDDILLFKVGTILADVEPPTLGPRTSIADGSEGQVLPAGATVNLRSGPVAEHDADGNEVGEITTSSLALHAGEFYRLYRQGFSGEAYEVIAGEGCPFADAADAAYGDAGFDFAQTVVPGTGVVSVATCAVESNHLASELLVSTRLFTAAGQVAHATRNVAPAGSIPTPSGIPLGDVSELTNPQAFITFPCFEARRVLQPDPSFAGVDTCTDTAIEAGGVDADPNPGLVGITLLAGAPTSTSAGLTSRWDSTSTALVGVRPFAHPEDPAPFDQAWVRPFAVDNAPRHLVRGPDAEVTVTVALDDTRCVTTDPEAEGPLPGCDPRLALHNPMPIVLLAAPPQVDGAGQSPAIPPTFAQSTTVGSSTDEVTAIRASVSIGVEVGTPVFKHFEIASEITYGQEVEDAVSHSAETTQGDAYFGGVDDDTVIYRGTSIWELPGTVVASSTGINTGRQTVLRFPRTNVVGSASMTFLEETFPTQYGTNAPLGNAVRGALTHTPGQPGTYMAYHNQTDGGIVPHKAIDDYCVGNFDGSELPDIPDAAVFPNPFRTEPFDTPDNAVLISNHHQVLAGSAGSEGASREIATGAEESYIRTHSVDVTVEMKYGPLTGGGSAGGSYGEGWSRSVGKGTAYEAAVGHIPYAALVDETYEWRLFTCQHDIGNRAAGESLTVWVQSFTVDGYQGQGGYGLGPVEAVSPLANDLVDPTDDPRLTWEQDGGVIDHFEWQLEAIGAAHSASGAHPVDEETGEVGYPTLEAGRFDPEDNIEVSVPVGDLLPDQLYRWKVTAIDFAGRSTSSNDVFFMTAGPPDPGFGFTPTTPAVGEVVTFTADEPTADGTTFEWTIDGTPLAGRTVQHAFGAAGWQTAGLTVTSAGGTASSDQQVPVRAVTAPNAYGIDEDTTMIVGAPGVLTDDDGPGEARLVSSTLHGQVRLAKDGSFTYEPEADYCGPDGFEYDVMTDGIASGNASLVALDIACVDDPPVALDDPGWVTSEDVLLEAPAPGVLANDTDVDSPTLTAALLTQPAGGTVSLAPTGAWTYAPDLDFCGADTFTYEAADETSASAPATVSVQVTCVDDPPTGPCEVVLLAIEDTITEGNLPDCHDPDGGSVTYVIINQPEDGGTITITNDGAYTFAPDLDFCGSATFTYRITSGDGLSRDVIGRIDVECVDDLPPPGEEPDVRPGEGGTTIINVAHNTTQIVITNVTNPATGTVEVDGTSILFTPLPGECGRDAFEYTITAPDGSTDTRTIEVETPCDGILDPSVVRLVGGSAAIADNVPPSVTDATGRDTHRLWGPDRYATSADIAREAWPTGSDVVFVATGQDFPDGLSAGAAAARFDAPMVLTRTDTLLPVTADVLTDMEPARIVIVGGTGAVSGEVGEQIAALTGVTPERVGGLDRYETAALVADMGWPDRADVVYVATGLDFPDALTGSAAAGRHQSPVLLTAPSGVSDAAAATLSRLRPERVVILGGQSAVPADIDDEISQLVGIPPDRLAGVDRFATASAIARDAWAGGARSAYLATGVQYPDALSSAAAAGRRRVPVLLVRTDSLPTATRATLQRLLE